MSRLRPGRRASYREGLSFAALSFGSVACVSLVSSVANSRIYGIEVIGEYAIAAATIAALRLASTTKERPALVRELATLEPRDARVTGLFVATLAFSAVLTCLVGALVLAVAYVLFSGPIGRPDLTVVAAVFVAGYVLLGNTAENLTVVFHGFRAGRQLFWIRLHEATVALALAVVLGLTNGTVWGLIGATLGAQATALVHRLFSVRSFMRFSASRTILGDGFRTLPSLIRFGLKITPGTLADGASNQSGTWILGSFASIASVGAYGRAFSLSVQLSTVQWRISEMLFPTLVERRAKRDGPGYSRALVDSLRYATIALLLPAAAAGGGADGVMRVFGPGFEKGADALAILLLFPALASLCEMQRLALYSLDRPWLASIAGLLRFITTVGLGFWLIPQLGATGAALALVLGLIIDLGFATRIVVGHLDSPFRALWAPPQLLGALVAYAAGFISSRLVYAGLSYPLGLVAGGAVGAIAYVAVLVLSGAVNDRDRERFQDVRRILARRMGRTQPASAGRGG
jgi:O-antigen/teichoic acid export membrane protein